MRRTPGAVRTSRRRSAHSREKHRLLEAYLTRYVATLTQNIKIDHLALTVVDGFAGGNVYIDETGQELPGSPSIIMRAIREAEFLANEKRTKRFRIKGDYFFIEKEKEAFCSLELTLKLSEHAGRIGNSIHLINDDFASHSSRIIEFVTTKSRSGRALFVLDQCGYDKVPFACIREIMQAVPNAEIILTFAADFLIDYLCEARPNRHLKSIPELDLDDLASRYDKSDPRWRSLIQLELHSEVQRAASAQVLHPILHPFGGFAPRSLARPSVAASQGPGRDDGGSLGSAEQLRSLRQRRTEDARVPTR